jgi:hypothetical protein
MSDPFFRVIKFSVSPQGIPLITAHARYWRAIHAEVMTHRCFSRNARSSRAVPVEKMLQEIRNDPFIPRHWGKNQKGMQASEECNEPVDVWMADECQSMSREEAWKEARNLAVLMAEGFADAGYHKQLVNRLLEPFMWIDTLITSTDWANFFALRDHKDAEPHLRDLAQLAKEELFKWRGKGTLLQPGQWHLPYVTEGAFDLETARKISAARCARISYAPFDGDSSIEKELARYDQLVTNWPVHASPVEHQATPDNFTEGYEGPYGEWRVGGFSNPNQHRNFRGWRQHRAMIPSETTWDTTASDRELVG